MALIVDKKTSKMLENRLFEFNEFGMVLYYLFEEGRCDVKDLENMFFSKDDEKATFLYGKIMKKISPKDLKLSFEKYKQEYPLEKQMDDVAYQKKLNILFTKKIIDLISSRYKDSVDKTYINTYEYLLTNIKQTSR